MKVQKQDITVLKSIKKQDKTVLKSIKKQLAGKSSKGLELNEYIF